MIQEDVNLMWKWVLALRSGKYQQGKRYLRRDTDSYCCLGVLCDISETGKWKSLKYPENCFSFDVEFIGGTTSTTSYPPLMLMNILWKFMMDRDDFIQMNDTQGKSFDDIADFIVQKLNDNVPADMIEEAKATVVFYAD